MRKRRDCQSAVEVLEARQLMAAGPEFQVAAGSSPLDAAGNPAGRSVVLLSRFQTRTIDLPGWGEATWNTEEVFARAYDASGAPVGPEVRVSDPQWRVDQSTGSPRPFYQLFDADVAMAGNGDFVVTWAKFAFGGQGTDGEIYTPLMARRYSAAGVPKGAAFELPRATIGGDLAMAVDGSFVVSRDYFGFSRYDATGRFISERGLNPAGAESFFDGRIGHTAVAAAPDGRFVMAWTKYAVEPGAIGAEYGSAIQAQRFDAAGRPLGSSFLVSNQSRLTKERPSVDVNAAGEFAVAWAADNNEYDLATEGPYVRRYDAAGNPRRSAFQLARPVTSGIHDRTTTAGASIALDDAGYLTAAWDVGPGHTFDGFGGFEADAYARRFAPSGEPAGGSFRVNATTAGGHGLPDLVVDRTGWVTAY